METNGDYHRRRAAEHRAQADQAVDYARRIHQQLADLHDARASGERDFRGRLSVVREK